ncbi:MAG TPA: hypothetical protein VNR70_02780 [Steroidobacteraceae bacterium]|nr:hypothetical protein [Steroidobacteraceae bacterium]
MSYQITFDGVASAELTHLLHAVQRQLNGRGMGVLGKMDAEAQIASSASIAPPCKKEPCPATEPGHNPNVIHALFFVGGVVVGFGLCKLLGNKVSAPTQTH